MKTKEELNAIKEEVDTVSKKLAELSEDELKQVTGGILPILFTSVAQGTMRPGVNWNSEELPTEPGNYKLDTDVEIGKEWIPDPGKTSLDFVK